MKLIVQCHLSIFFLFMTVLTVDIFNLENTVTKKWTLAQKKKYKTTMPVPFVTDN